MKIYSSTSRAIWLFPTRHLNPDGVSVGPVFDDLKRKYSFLPTPLENNSTIEKDGLKLERGTFINERGLPTGVNITVHTDGIVAETASSTEDGDFIIGNVLEWLAESHGFARPSTIPFQRIYSSELFFELPDGTPLHESKFRNFLAALSTAMGDTQTGPYDFFGVHFSTDPAKYQKVKTFRVEREINSPFASNRYYSFASTRTKVHIELLDHFALLI